MAYKFTYITIQHSGTRFLERYFIHIGFSPLTLTSKCKTCNQNHGYEKYKTEANKSGRYEYSWRHYAAPITSSFNIPEESFSCPVISTLRHPYKTAISFLSRGYDLRKCLLAWETYIKFSMHHNIIHYNIDCKKENRTAQLLNLVKQIDCYDENTEKLTDEFILDWKPVGEYNSKYKADYLLDGTLPDVFDWSRFDRAVNWYEKRIEECEY